MRYRFVLVATLTVCLITSFAAKNPQDVLKTDNDKLSYSLGVTTAQAFKSHAVNVDPDIFSRGFRDAMLGQKTLLSDKAINTIVQQFQAQSQQKAQEKYGSQAKKNLATGKKFLEDNSKKPGVISLNNALQYKVIKEGKGKQPLATDTVVVNYEGKLINGKIFDSSYKRGQPASFPVNQVIDGWQQALKMMRPGATWMLYIPSKLAYGSADVPNIGPNQVLIFKIHLISIKKKK